MLPLKSCDTSENLRLFDILQCHLAPHALQKRGNAAQIALQARSAPVAPSSVSLSFAVTSDTRLPSVSSCLSYFAQACRMRTASRFYNPVPVVPSSCAPCMCDTAAIGPIVNALNESADKGLRLFDILQGCSASQHLPKHVNAAQITFQVLCLLLCTLHV